jgi:NAD-dependent DNA ligase
MQSDAQCAAEISRCPNAIVPWWLMASYLYYRRGESLLSDGYFDQLCRDLIANWDAIEHRHKHLIDREQLDAGTGYYLASADYPTIIRHGACHLMGIKDDVEIPLLPGSITIREALMEVFPHAE